MKRYLLVALMLVALLPACKPDLPETEIPAVEQENEPDLVMDEQSLETSTRPQIGGTMIIALSQEQETLDPQKTVGGAVTQFMGASLVAEDPETGELVPYLAENWMSAEDGMYWDFKLREDVVFHNGTSMTAHDFVWTIQRALDPETMSPMGAILQGVAGAEVIDDYTLRVNMAMPNFSFISNVSKSAFLQPLPQTYLEEVGDDVFARNPIGVGPFIFKEWVTGEKIVLERNPNFNWGPAFSHGGAPFIETIEFRVFPEYSTILAGLEAGELDYAIVEDQDIHRLVDTGAFNIFEITGQGSSEEILFNVTKPPFDDVRVRKAFNLAVDRNVLVQILESGNAEVRWGPVTSSVRGYWSGVEEIGYDFDLEKAKELMSEAGYTLNAEGLLEKNGEILQLTLLVLPSYTQLATVLQEQYKHLGVDLEIEQAEIGVLRDKLITGDYSITLGGFGWDESTALLFAMFHSSMVGVLNYSLIADPELDQMLQTAMFATDVETNQNMLEEAQRYIVEQAFVAPLYAPKVYFAIRNTVHDWYLTPSLWDIPFDAYITEE